MAKKSKGKKTFSGPAVIFGTQPGGTKGSGKGTH